MPRSRFLIPFGLFLLSACGSAPVETPATPSPEAIPSDVPAASPNPVPKLSVLPGLYHRIYQGYRIANAKPKADVKTKTKSKKKSKAKPKPDSFLKTMNTKFFPLFAKAHAQGLEMYRPALPKNPKACELPSEVALLSFWRESDYERYRKSKLGKRIRNAHKPVFRADSQSLVAEPLGDSVEYGHAYSLNPGRHEYQNLEASVVIHCDPALTGDDLKLALVKAYAMGTEATDILFVPAADHVLEFVFYPRASEGAKRIAERKERFKSAFRESVVVRLPRKRIEKKMALEIGEGFTADWTGK